MEDPRNSSEELAAHWAKSQPVIAEFVAAVIPDPDNADDIVQSVALVTARRFSEYDKSRPFVAWAIGIAKNLILKHYEDRRSTILGSDAVEQIAQSYDAEDWGELHMEADRMRALRLCMERLNARWRTVLEMHYMREMAPAGVAQQLNISRTNVFVILHRARIALRECIEQRLRQENL